MNRSATYFCVRSRAKKELTLSFASPILAIFGNLGRPVPACRGFWQLVPDHPMTRSPDHPGPPADAVFVCWGGHPMGPPTPRCHPESKGVTGRHPGVDSGVGVLFCCQRAQKQAARRNERRASIRHPELAATLPRVKDPGGGPEPASLQQIRPDYLFLFERQ